jgi:hypothetical protein
MIKISDKSLRKKKNMSVIRRFDHKFLLWKNFMQAYIDLNLCYLIETKLRQLHRRFDHSSTRKLHDLLERVDHEVKNQHWKNSLNSALFVKNTKNSLNVSSLSWKMISTSITQ